MFLSFLNQIGLIGFSLPISASRIFLHMAIFLSDVSNSEVYRQIIILGECEIHFDCFGQGRGFCFTLKTNQEQQKQNNKTKQTRTNKQKNHHKLVHLYLNINQRFLLLK